jgi:hypothetical protein
LKYETSNIFLETVINEVGRGWSILTNHAGSCWASPTDARPRDIAASLGITGRSAYGIVTDLTAAGVRRQGRKTAAATATRSRRTYRDNQRAEARRRAGKALDTPKQHSGSGW